MTMLQQAFHISKVSSPEYRDLFDLALRATPDYGEFTASCAYATRGGVSALEDRFREELGDNWKKIKKSWIVGVDYCRSEPVAMEHLASLPRSKVRVPHGNLLVSRRMCVPDVTFHPKAFMLEGNGTTALVVGSGNLSRAAMLTGIEAGCVTVAKAPHPSAEKSIVSELGEIRKRIALLWRLSTPYERIAKEYEECFNAAENLKNPSPTDDDSAETDLTASRGTRHRSVITAQRLKQMRACRHLWIEAGNLHENRGQGRPGNQLMLSRMTRVFFGFPATDASRDSYIGSVSIRHEGRLRDDCSLRFSNNSMDVLTLPIPETEGPESYDGESLLFRTIGLTSFELVVGTPSAKRKWVRNSEKLEGLYKMSSGRKWGVF